MAALDTSRPAAQLNGGFLTTVFTNVFGAAIAWNDARVTRNALAQLTDRELDDVGLTRADLRDIATIIR